MASQDATRSRNVRPRAVGLAMILLIALPLTGSSAHAREQAEVGMSQTGYYTNTQDPSQVSGEAIADVLCQVPSPDPRTCLDPGGVVGATPGWPRNDNYLYVARIGGEDDAYGYATVDLFAVPFGATILGLDYEFQVEAEGDTGTLNFDPEDPHVMLCLVTEDWVGADGGPWDDRPSHDCGVSAGIELVDDEVRQEDDPQTGTDRDRRVITYRADLMPMAAEWGEGSPNYGVAFVPDEDAPDNWQVAVRSPFIAEDAMRAFVEFDPPEPIELDLDLDDEPREPVTSPRFVDEFVEEDPPPATTRPFRVERDEPEPQTRRVRRALPESDPHTPWWVWLVLPLGVGTLATVGRGLAAPAPVEHTRIGPVSRLLRKKGPTEGGD